MSKLITALARLLNSFRLKKLSEIFWVEQKKSLNKKIHNLTRTHNLGISEELLSSSLVPKREVVDGLAEETIYLRTMQFFDVFGFTTLRNFFGQDDMSTINELLNVTQRNKFKNQTVFASPVEYSQKIQEILIHGPLFDVISRVIGPFWYYGSDAAVETGPFPLHRDTFFNPPLYKIFMPTRPATFQILCGSHHTSDDFGTNAGRYVCSWDKSTGVFPASSSIYFDNFNKSPNIVAFDDTRKNPPLTNIPLNPGDVFIFNQNLVHGLLPRDLVTSFIAISVFPSPENSKKFKMNRWDHLENIIRSTISVTLIEKELSATKKMNASEILLPGKAFSDNDLEKLLSEPKLKEYFSLAKIPSNKWEVEIKKNSHASWEILRDFL